MVEFAGREESVAEKVTRIKNQLGDVSSRLDSFEESKHPRAADGKFGSGGGKSDKPAKKAKKAPDPHGTPEEADKLVSAYPMDKKEAFEKGNPRLKEALSKIGYSLSYPSVNGGPLVNKIKNWQPGSGVYGSGKPGSGS